MLKLGTVGSITRSSLYRLLSSCVDPTCRREAPLIENECVLTPPEDLIQEYLLAEKICVPIKVDLTPIGGMPDEHVKNRRVRIYQPIKNLMQSGSNNLSHWEIEWDNRQRWENSLMGWCSTGDPLSNLKVNFSQPQEAIEHCEKMGWTWFVDIPRTELEVVQKSYSYNFSWNKRTRISTK